jgi:glycosyltransferase involved in cell wall biosynthesis
MVRWYYRHFFPRFARKATRIATVSEYSRSDLVKSYGISADKIDVVYNGANPIFKPLDDKEKESVRNYYCSGDPFFVFLSALHPRKNMCKTLEAFELFKKRTGFPHKLIMVGETLFKTDNMKRVYAQMTHKDDVIFLGRIEHPETSKILGAALALLYVPLYEGFGIPILEGFRCEVPVIAGNRTSLPEVGGNAALYVDPHSAGSISEGMIRLVNDPALQRDLVQKGTLRKEVFTWDRTAELLCESINKTVNLTPCHV